MATLTIGGRALDVRPATLGFIKRSVLPWKRSVPVAPPGEPTVEQAVELEEKAIDWHVAGLLLYLGHNEGVTTEWLLEHVVDAGAALRQAQILAGQEAPEAGEAARP